MSNLWYGQAEYLLDASLVRISDTFPSVWAEENIVMEKPFPGPLRYNMTPYTREIVDRAHLSDPIKEIVIMGSAQWGKTGSVANPFLVWMIRNCPGPTIMTIATANLIDGAVNKLDYVIDITGTRPYISNQSNRNKNQKTGDTNTKKEFPGGWIRVTTASNPREIRADSLQYAVFDDFDAMRSKSKSDGDQRLLLLQRFKTYYTNRKIFWISTPTIKGESNIEEAFLMGDQRKFYIPCPCCSAFITLEWEVEKEDGTKAGIVWQLDEKGRVQKDTVGYVCQECAGFFTDHNKTDYVNKGYWKATAEPTNEDVTSYYMNALYSPPGMADWYGIIKEYMECFKHGERDEYKYQTFENTQLGRPHEIKTQKIEAKDIQKNQIDYTIGLIPEKVSINHGNGRIVLLTCGVDLNGTLDDARLDFQIKGWSESGSAYSIVHGSIGTYYRGEGQKRYKEDRKKYTYDWTKPDNVWDELYTILSSEFATDTERAMNVFCTTIDEGYMTHFARQFAENCNLPNVFTVKGSSADNKYNPSIDKTLYKRAVEVKTGKLYVLNVGKIKDMVAEKMKLVYDEKIHDSQPAGFMNFPYSSDGLYQFNNFFSHYEAEERRIVESKDGVGVTFRWVKKTEMHQNHQWDCCVYNYAAKEIVADLVCQDAEIKNHTWADFVSIVTSF
jgi:phage terminase large subunit GpA-like protein